MTIFKYDYHFLRFCRAVIDYLWRWIKAVFRWLSISEYRLQHFFSRLIVVESRIHGLAPKLKLIWRWLNLIWHRYRKQPRHLQLWQLAAMIVLIITPSVLQSINQWQARGQLYDRLYAHFYDTYILTHSDKESGYYADYYAEQFAEYYTSDAYREALRYALPVAEERRKVIAQARQASPKIRVLEMNQAGLDLLMHFEGLRLKPYRDVGGKYTIGYGHLMRPEERYLQISQDQAEILLKRDLETAEAVVKSHVRVPLTENQFSALVSLVYNIGGYHFQKSTLLRHLNEGEYRSAAAEILRWEHVSKRKIKGLTRRRQAEYRLFMN
jgi:lysozyme